MTDYAAVNGVLTPLAEASISVLDLGFLRGMAVFESLRTYKGYPHALPQHLQRLRDSAAALDIELEPQEHDLRKLLRTIAEREPHVADWRINLILTPGEHSHGVFGAEQPNWVLIARALSEPPQRWYTEGIKVITFKGERVHPEYKTTTYLTGRRGLLAAGEAGADEALYVDDNGEVFEGVTSNVLALRGNTIISPRLPNLPGITKAGLLRVAKDMNLDYSEEHVTRDSLLQADEVWICSSFRELVPVVDIDGSAVGHGRPGPVAAALHQRYHASCVAEAAADDAADRRL